MVKYTKPIGEILITKGLITQTQLQDALKEQKTTGKFLGKILVEKGLITSRELSHALSEQFGINLIDLKEQHIDMELARRFSSSVVIEHKCFPLKEDEDTLTIAIVNPLDAEAVSIMSDEVRPKKVALVLAFEEDMDQLIKNYRQYISQSIQRILKIKPFEKTE